MLVESLTKDRMLAIEAASVVDGHIDGAGHLILEKHDGSTIDAGNALLAIPNASTSQVGVLELATQAEVNAGVDAIRAVTPATLVPLTGRVSALETAPGYKVQIINPLAQTDLINSYPLGLSLMAVGSGSGWTPNGGFGTVVTYYHNISRASQTFYGNNNDKEWRRYYYQDTLGSGIGWGPWRFQGHEESLFTPSFTQSTPVGSYPEGSSHMWITASQATSQGWSFAGNYGTLRTIRPWGTTDAQQIWQKATGPSELTVLWIRAGNSSGWSSWKAIATEEYVNNINAALDGRLDVLETRKEHLGTTNCNVVSATALSQHVTFPSALPGIPKVFCNMDGAPGASAAWTVRAINMTATGFDIFLRNTDSTAGTFNTNVSWQAIYKP